MRAPQLSALVAMLFLGCSGDAPTDAADDADTGLGPDTSTARDTGAPADEGLGDGATDGGGADATIVDSAPGDAAKSDAVPVDADAGARRCDPTKPFGAPVYAPDVNLGSTSDEGATLSADELTIYLDSNRAGGAGCTDVWRATRTSREGAFGAPTPLAGVNSAQCDRGLSVTADGLFLYTASNASGGATLRVAARPNTLSDFGGFGTVSGISAALDGGTSAESSPWVMPDHGALYFSSNRSGFEDIYRAARIGDAYQAPKLVIGVNTPSQEGFPVVSPDELTIYFASDRAGGAGALDIYSASRLNTGVGFSNVTNLATLNSDRIEMPTWVSADGCVMYLARHMQTTSGGVHYDIMVAKRPL